MLSCLISVELKRLLVNKYTCVVGIELCCIDFPHSLVNAYICIFRIPDTPAEPDPENHTPSDPVHIPLDDVTGNTDSVNDFHTTPWPDPKTTTTAASEPPLPQALTSLLTTIGTPAMPPPQPRPMQLHGGGGDWRVRLFLIIVLSNGNI